MEFTWSWVLFIFTFTMMLWGCQFSEVQNSEDQSLPEVQSDEVQNDELQKSVVVLNPNLTPLEHREIEWSEIAPLLKEPLQFPLKTTAIANLITSPCPDSWRDKKSVAESLVQQSCLKDREIFLYIDQQLTHKSVEEILEFLVFPGPYFQVVTPSVWIENSKVDSVLRSTVKRILELELWDCTVIIFDDHSLKIYSIPEKNRQKLTDWIDRNGKLRQIVPILQEELQQNSEVLMNPNALEIRSSPTWFIKGYRMRGLQSHRQFQRILQYP